MKMYLPSSFILRYVRAEMNVHAFMNELDQKDYWYPRKFENCEILYTKSMESCPLVISHILAEFHLERATYKTLHNYFSDNGLSNFAQNFTVGFLNLLSTYPIHIVVWGNVPFKLHKHLYFIHFHALWSRSSWRFLWHFHLFFISYSELSFSFLSSISLVPFFFLRGREGRY